MGQLDGKVAVITASTRSIGRGIAEAFLAEGAKVVISGRNAEKGAVALKEIGGGDNLHFIACDATKKGDIEALVNGTVAHFGKLDIAVFNAVWPPSVGSKTNFPFTPSFFISSFSRTMIFSMHSGVIGSM